MKYKKLHEWNLSVKDAIRIQNSLKNKIVLKRFPKKNLKLVAGVDVSVKDNLSQASIVVLSFPGLGYITKVTHVIKTPFPYVPGLLSFREGPVILKCIEKLSVEPDLFIFDGQGLAHPRKMGLACHIGLFLNKPSIGSAKSHLYGKYNPPKRKKGNYSIMKDADGQPIGAALATRDNIKPVFVSPGHLTDIPSSIDIVISCCPKYKIPEPIRVAHNAAHL